MMAPRATGGSEARVAPRASGGFGGVQAPPTRRTFLGQARVAAATVLAAPLLLPGRATAAADRLVVAVGQWGTETPFAWRSSQSTYGSPPFDEPSLAWQRAVHSKGAFNILAEGPYDEEIDTILREINPDKRTKLTQALGQKLYDQYHGVMLGVKSTTWAVSKKVGGWQTLGYVPMETNYEYVSAAS